MALQPTLGIPSTFSTTLDCLPLCAHCNRPVFLEAANTDEQGQAVHEECYLVKVIFEKAS